jgi:hypothetical protein
MPQFSVANLPEIFVSDTSISKPVSEAVERGQLRRLASRLYTRNLTEDPERLVRRNWYYLVPGYYPDATIRRVRFWRNSRHLQRDRRPKRTSPAGL